MLCESGRAFDLVVYGAETILSKTKKKKRKVQVVGDGVAAVDKLHVNALIKGYIWS